MKHKMSDQDVLNLLTGLKNAESSYPTDMIRSRRDMFAKQAAAMAVLAKAGVTGKNATATGSGQAVATGTASVGTSMGTLLEAALVVAIVVEAGVATYIYRDKIAGFVRSALSPTVDLVASQPGISSSDNMTSEITASDTLVGTVVATGTDTTTPNATILPALNGGDDNDGGQTTVSTPAPTDDHPGLHLGQTKQPTPMPKKDNNKKD